MLISEPGVHLLQPITPANARYPFIGVGQVALFVGFKGLTICYDGRCCLSHSQEEFVKSVRLFMGLYWV